MVIPPVRLTTIDIHARLSGGMIGRLSRVPVGVSHRGHSLAVPVCWGHSPDERRRLNIRVYALSSRPEMRSVDIICIASSQRFL